MYQVIWNVSQIWFSYKEEKEILKAATKLLRVYSWLQNNRPTFEMAQLVMVFTCGAGTNKQYYSWYGTKLTKCYNVTM